MGFIRRGAGVRFLFILAGLNVASGAATVAPQGIEWSHDPAIAGFDMDVTIKESGCFPITVTLIIDGEEDQVRTVDEAPTTLVFPIPREAVGKTYKIEVRCGNDTTGDAGVVM
jgi:hypothetical protein